MVVSKILLHNLYLFSFDFIVSVESFSNEMYEKNLTLRKCYDAVCGHAVNHDCKLPKQEC